MNPNGNYPTEYECRLILKNGSEIFLRPIMVADEKLVVDASIGTSRFFAIKAW